MGRLGSPIVLAAILVSCSEAARQVDQDAARDEIKASLDSYLPLLAQAYATGNLEPLREFAAEKEVARIFKRVDELATLVVLPESFFHSPSLRSRSARQSVKRSPRRRLRRV